MRSQAISGVASTSIRTRNGAGPERDTAPPCCSQRTVELGEEARGKLRQTHRWESADWIKDDVRRTFVEDGFDELRNPVRGALARGKFCVIGIIKVTLMLAALTAWAAALGLNSDNPALAPTDDDWAFKELDPSATPPPARRFREHRRPTFVNPSWWRGQVFEPATFGL